MVKTRVHELLRVFPQPPDRHKGNAERGAVIRHESHLDWTIRGTPAAGRLKDDLAANDDGVPIDHFLQSRRLEIEVMQGRSNDMILHASSFASLLILSGVSSCPIKSDC